MTLCGIDRPVGPAGHRRESQTNSTTRTDTRGFPWSEARLMGRPDPQIRAAMLSHLRRNHNELCRHWFDDIELIDLNAGTLRVRARAGAA